MLNLPILIYTIFLMPASGWYVRVLYLRNSLLFLVSFEIKKPLDPWSKVPYCGSASLTRGSNVLNCWTYNDVGFSSYEKIQSFWLARSMQKFHHSWAKHRNHRWIWGCQTWWWLFGYRYCEEWNCLHLSPGQKEKVIQGISPLHLLRIIGAAYSLSFTTVWKTHRIIPYVLTRLFT